MRPTTDLISILMPCKNEATYLPACIESIISQTYELFELIIVDDHSNDDSYTIMTEAQKQDDRIKIYTSEGIGTIDALKTAEKYITGNFVTRMDADDLMPKHKLEELLSVLKSAGEGHIATGLVSYFSDSELKDGFKSYESWLNQLCIENTHWQHIFKECVIASPNWMMFRRDFEKIGGFTDLVYPEDYHFVFKLYSFQINVKSSKNVTHLWRDHPERASRNLEQYKDQKFYELKLIYFEMRYGSENIVLWGAGPTGKKLAREMLGREIHFRWVSNNKKKIGERIYDVLIEDRQILKANTCVKVIIAVTQLGALKKIKERLEEFQIGLFVEF